MTTQPLTETNRGKQKTSKQNIVIVGQGAMGLLCYHHLQQAKNQVSLFSSSLSAEVNLPTSQQTAKSTTAMYSFTAYQGVAAQTYPLLYATVDDIKQADVIIICVKSYQTVTAIKSIANSITETCLIILAHNGMGTLAEVIKLLPVGQRVLAMLTTHGCLRHSPLKIAHTGIGHSDIGLLAGVMTDKEINTLTSLLNQALPTFAFEKDIPQKQWLKLAINCVINPITALNNIKNGQVNLPRFTEMKTALIAEIVAIAQAEGIYLTNAQLKETIRIVAQATAENSSSMRCDVLAKRQTEIDYINGYIHRLGIKHRIATPMNTQVWQAVNKLQDRR